MNKALRVTQKTSSNLILFIILSITCSTFTLAKAQDEPDWWFDVEILIFKHNNAKNTVTEQFDSAVDKPFSSRIDNIFLPFYVIDISWLQQALPTCSELSVQLDCSYPPSLSDLVERNQPVDHYQDYSVLPITYEGVVYPRSEHAHVLPSSQLQLTSLYKDINWDKAYTPLLHSVWRQPVNINAENAVSIPILAGKNLTYTAPEIREAQTTKTTDTDATTSKRLTVNQDNNGNNTLLSTIKSALASETILYPDQLKTTQDKGVIETTSTFEFEGLVTIYIKYINRVPYLHIDSHALFNTAQHNDVSDLTESSITDPISNSSLNGATNSVVTITPHTFKQRRRIISNQVHYFDHPYFGMVVELRRYKRPAITDTSDTNDLLSQTNTQ